MNHIIIGNNFHGDYSITLRGPKIGFTLSTSQVKKYNDAMCGRSDCHCGGSYGTGADSGSATIAQAGWDSLELIPGD